MTLEVLHALRGVRFKGLSLSLFSFPLIPETEAGCYLPDRGDLSVFLTRALLSLMALDRQAATDPRSRIDCYPFLEEYEVLSDSASHFLLSLH
jgi:hypothetical protein